MVVSADGGAGGAAAAGHGALGRGVLGGQGGRGAAARAGGDEGAGAAFLEKNIFFINKCHAFA